MLVVVLAVATGASGARKGKTVVGAAWPLNTSIWYHGQDTSADSQVEIERIRAAGATTALIYLYWSAVAPGSQPTGFNPRDREIPPTTGRNTTTRSRRWPVRDSRHASSS